MDTARRDADAAVKPDSRLSVPPYDISVLIPCINDEANIASVVDRTIKVFEKMGIRGELVLIDNGSGDSTRQKIQSAIRSFPDKVSGVFKDKNIGIEGAWRAGLSVARSQTICVMDSGRQYLPEDIYRLYREYKHLGVDVMQGCRTTITRERNFRFFLSIGLNAVLNLCFGRRGKDNKSGFFCTRKEVLHDILHHSSSYNFFPTFVIVAAKAKGYSIGEIEVLCDTRLPGTSFTDGFPPKVITLVFVDLLKALFEYRFSRQRTSYLDRFLTDHPVDDRSEKWSAGLRRYFAFYMFVMPLHHWLITRRAGEYFFSLRKTQWLKPQEIREMQMIRLRALLAHAYRHTPYWRELFDRIGLVPDDIESLDDLRRLPFLEKATVRERVYFDLISDNYRRKDIQRISTSGSTGQPLVCYADRTQLELRWASTLRGQEWTGYKFGDRCVRLWHQTIGMSRSQIFREKMDALFLRRTFIPAYQIGEHNIRSFLATIERARPVFIDGYAESFNFLSTYLKGHGLTTAMPRGIMSSAQMLPKQSRLAIEAAFKTKVYDKYGSREFSGIAYECGHAPGTHHVCAESYIVEIIKDGQPAKPGEMGEVVVTDLNNYCMPLIRYRVGDLARAVEGDCPCGRGLPLIGEIEGRTQAIIVGKQKQYVPGTFFAHYFKEYDYALRQYQVEQQEEGSMILRLVRTPRFNDAILKEIVDGLQVYLGPNMRIDVEYPETIALSRTGKVQVSISKLGLDFQKLKA